MKQMDSGDDGDVALSVFEVCEEAKKLLTSHWELNGQTDQQAEVESRETSCEDQEIDIRLWKSIAENMVEVDTRNILLNIEIAAAHIRLLITEV
jgi:hypothetical protein